MSTFRFTLQPYGPGQKQTCPGCGHKKCFVRYMDRQTNVLLPSEYGRCERVNSCGYHKAPDAGIAAETRGKDFQDKSTIVRQQFIDETLVKATFRAYDQNPFAVYLAAQFGGKEAAEAIKKYHIGTAKNGGTIFWHRNIWGKYGNGKRIFYKQDGKRNREIPPGYTHLTAKGFKICLFGEHLISDKPVAIVESEKSAVIGSIYRPELTWCACGGANGLTLEKMAPLAKKRVLLFTDFDQAGRTAFRTAEAKLRQTAFPEFVDPVPERDDGTDIADLFLLTPPSAEKLLINADGYPANWEN